MTIATDTSILSLVQWLSPAFPTGAFAYSHGLEVAMALGEVRDAHDLSLLLRDVLEHGSGWTDAVLLARGLLPDADLDALSDIARALAPSAERLRETVDQGAAFALTTAALTGQDHPARPLPVAVAQAARALRLPRGQIIGVYLHAFTSNLVSCAVRFIPLGQTTGQATLAALHPVISRLANAATRPGAMLATAALRADLGSMAHETLQPRIFRT
jgi:urease accessory protein